MVATNKLQKAPPFHVSRALKQLGADLRTARIRRNMTMEDAASRIGTGLRAVMDAEKGKASTGIVVYAGLLWLYDMLQPPRRTCGSVQRQRRNRIASDAGAQAGS
ncbi:hypothetical protein [Bradyrhizobium sp. JR3.5]